MARNDGKKFEHDLHEQFRQLHLSLPIHWERVVDSYEAGNLVRKPDCDFKLTVKSDIRGQPHVHYIECKSSVTHKSLRNCLRSILKTDQVAKMRMAARAGVNTWYLFRDETIKQVEVWKGSVIHRVFEFDERLKEGPWSICRVEHLPDLFIGSLQND